MKDITKSLMSAMWAVAAVFGMDAAEPSGYYDACEGKCGQELLKALCATIADHTNVGYDGLWEVYKSSDVRADGTLWDIYTTKQWSSNFTKCGNYKNIGDCVNREHSFPKSWWGGSKQTQYADAFHLYPTDGKVNGQRSNYPYGECAGGTRLASNGSVQALGRLGTSTFSGYTDKVFEPDDEYKGDLARSYFYMATAYNSSVSGWTQGNGGAMMAGNSYPVFTTWATNLLLKWSRQDEVSQKELDRNDAIYKYQHNRNPYIDHPELVEHIWGDKRTVPWYANSTPTPELVSPVKDVPINMGKVAVGIPRSLTYTVRGRNLTEALMLSASGDFTVTPSKISASDANNGAVITISVTAATPGDAEGVLKISSSELSLDIDLLAEAVNGLPVSISDVTDDGFSVNWVNVNAGTSGVKYTLNIVQGAESVSGYPVSVDAATEKYVVTGLEPLTAYAVTVQAPGGVSSEALSVTTADLIPYIQLLFDGELDFDAEPDVASAVAEILMEVENVSDDITVTVTAPFSVSSDKSGWGESVTLSPEEERFYLRLNPSAAGSYHTVITVSAGDYSVDDYEATATVAPKVDFLETWEGVQSLSGTKLDSYDTKTVAGAAAQWSLNNAGFWNGDTFNGTTVMRVGKNPTSSITMAEDKTGGIGTVEFDAGSWTDKEGDAGVAVEYSTDGGSTWTSAGTVTVTGADSKRYSVPVNVGGKGRIRLRQTSGARWMLDNIGISDYSAMGAVQTLEYHSWDAFCRSGELVIEVSESVRTVSVYSMDGMTVLSEAFAPGTYSYNVPKGLYVVVSNDFSRTVLVK
ncbi:MAG: endonuclease [Muribaculaceae bacterium]|nr:endonuclease [Muribaculaceae bacterium]